jgi:hypothetical protein
VLRVRRHFDADGVAREAIVNAAAKRRDALRECLEEAIGRDLAAGVTRTALRLASVTEPPTEVDALRLYVEGPLATAVAEALGRDAATALVHIVRARLFAPNTMPPPARTVSVDMAKAAPAEVATSSAIRRSDKRFIVALRCADALRRAETARSLVQTHCDVVLVFGVDDVARLREKKTRVDLAVMEIEGVDAERVLRDLADATNAAVIVWVDDDRKTDATRVLRSAGVERFVLLPKSASSRELVESATELLVGVVRSR